MPTKPTVLSRAAGIFFYTGYFIFLLGVFAKENLPQSTGLSPALQLPCAFFSAVLIPFGSFLALRQLVTGTDKSRTQVFYHLGGCLFLVAILSTYFFYFYLLSRTLEIILPLDSPSPAKLLVKLVDSATSAASKEKRAKAAAYAYRIYGATITYQPDGSQIVLYQPTADDEAGWRETQALNRQVEQTRSLLTKTLIQIPYLAGLYASTFTITYVVGGACLACRIPRGGSALSTLQH